MRFLIDENLPTQLSQMARDAGFEAVWVRDELPGAKDLVILDRLFATHEVLVTRDVGFANSVFAQMVVGKNLAGAVLIREQRLQDIVSVWQQYLHTPRIVGGLVVLTNRGTRVRRPE